MNKIIFILTLFFLYQTGLAQKCTGQDDLSKLSGAWKLSAAGEMSQSAADVSKEKLVLENIQQIIRSHFKWAPLGGDIFYSMYFPARWTILPLTKICNVYGTELHFLDFQCIEGRLKHNETPTWFYVDVNKTPFEFKESFFVSRLSKEGSRIDDDPETDVYAFLPEIPDAKGSWYDYTADGFSGGGDMMENHSGSAFRVLHKKDALPFCAMPKKEYYQKWKIYYRQQMKQKELVIEAMAADYGKTAGGVKMLEDARKMARADEIFVSRIDTMLLTKSAEALSLPAMRGEELGEFYDTAGARQCHRDFVIKPKLAYYHTNLPKSSPQLITLHFTYAYTLNAQKSERRYSEAGFVAELQRINIMNLLAEKLQPVIIQ